MAASRKPGPQCSYNDGIDIDSGTSSRTLSPDPLPLGNRLPSSSNALDADFLSSAAVAAVQHAPTALLRETGYTFDRETLKGLIPALVQTLSATALSGAPAGKRVILTALGLNFLSESIEGSLGEVICVLPRMDRSGDCEPEQAGEALARAGSILARLILRGVVVRLAGDVPATREALIGQFRSSKLGDGFALWIEQNWKDLLTNPRLRVESKRSGGGADIVVSERKSRAPAAVRPPAADPPTFPAINAAAQAATLVAAAAQGAPFCPL
jgi:hypothetical protein